MDKAFNINNIKIITNSNYEYDITKNLNVNNTLSYNKLYSSPRDLHNNLSNDTIKQVIANLDVNPYYISTASSTNVATKITPTTIDLITTTSAEYTYTFNIESPLMLLSVVAVTNDRDITYYPKVTGTARACVKNTRLSYVDYTPDNGKFNFTAEVTIQVEANYTNSKRPTITLGFNTLVGLVTKNINVNLINS